MIDFVVENMQVQWITDAMRITGQNKPSRLDMLSTMGPCDIHEVNHQCPLGKSDCMVTEMEKLVEERKKYKKDVLKEYFRKQEMHKKNICL